MPESTRQQEWSVNIPFSDLHHLMNHLESLDGLKRENAQLRREMDGLRNMFNELLNKYGELRRELTGR